jgi:hypothetical protein
MKQVTDIDDSWIDIADKKLLIKELKTLYTTKFDWADDALIESLVKYHYTATIKQIDEDAYLKEKKCDENMTFPYSD